MSLLGVRDVAERLGVSERRVRQMLQAGDLRGSRVGRSWVVESRALLEAEHAARPVGRPWSPASAWAVLGVAEGEDGDLDGLQRSRARARLRSEGLDGLVDRLASRAKRHRYFCHPGMLDRLEADPRLVRSGVSALGEYPCGLMVSGEAEGYVRASDLESLERRFALDDQSDRPNIVLHVVDDEVWPFEPGQVVASRSVVAVDLMDAGDDRSRRAGARLVLP